MLSEETISFLESLTCWREMLKEGRRHLQIAEYLLENYHSVFAGYSRKDIVSYFCSHSRWRRIQHEQKAWDEYIQECVFMAKNAGYKVTSLCGGSWLIEARNFSRVINSGGELFLFLVDCGAVKPKQLRESKPGKFRV